jgi:glutathione S-transferase
MANLPVLYSFRRCPYAMRARLAIVVSGLRVELREVVLKNKPTELLAASPKATVPVLVLPNGEVIDESLNVMLWALRQHDPEQWLEPHNPEANVVAMADMLALIAANDGPFKHSLDRYKYSHRFTAEHRDVDATSFAQRHRSVGAAWLCRLEPQLKHGHLFGARTSLADMALLPFVRQFAHSDATWFAAQPWPHLQAWLAAFEHSSLFASVMCKHLPWPSAQAVASDAALLIQ